MCRAGKPTKKKLDWNQGKDTGTMPGTNDTQKNHYIDTISVTGIVARGTGKAKIAKDNKKHVTTSPYPKLPRKPQ